MATGAVLAAEGPADPRLRSVVTLGERIPDVADLVAVAVVAAGSVALAVALAHGSLTAADLSGQTRAASEGAAAAAADGALGAGGPLGRALLWVLARGATLEHGPLAVLAVSAHAAVGVAAWALLRRGRLPRFVALVPLAALAVGGPLAGAALDPHRDVPVLVCAAAVLVALAAHLYGSPGAARLAVIATATVVGVAADLSALATPLVLAAGAAALASPPRGEAGRPERRFVGVDVAGVATAAAAAMIAGAAALASGAPAGAGRVDAAGLGAAVRRAVGGLAGAPWSRRTGGQEIPTGTVPLAVLAVVGIGVAALVVLAALRDAKGTALAALLAVAWTTAAALGAGAGDGAAWHVAAIATAAWAAAVAVAPSPFAPRPPAPRPPAPRPPAPRPPAPGGAEPSVDGAARRLGPSVVAGVLLVAVFAGGVIGLATQARAAAANPVGPWLDAVRRSLDAVPPFPRIVPRALPPGVRSATLDLDAPVVATLRPDALLHDGDGPMLALDDGGRLGAADPRLLASTPRSPLCADVVEPGARRAARLALVRPAPLAPGALVRVAVLVKDTTELDVRVEDAAGNTRPVLRWGPDVLYQGAHTAVFPVPPGGDAVAVLVGPTSPGAGLCIVSTDLVQQP